MRRGAKLSLALQAHGLPNFSPSDFPVEAGRPCSLVMNHSVPIKIHEFSRFHRTYEFRPKVSWYI